MGNRTTVKMFKLTAFVALIALTAVSAVHIKDCGSSLATPVSVTVQPHQITVGVITDAPLKPVASIQYLGVEVDSTVGSVSAKPGQDALEQVLITFPVNVDARFPDGEYTISAKAEGLCATIAAEAINGEFTAGNAEEKTATHFFAFMTKYSKKYSSVNEFQTRMTNFRSTLNRVHKRNQDETETVFGVTKFADLTPAEFKQTYLGYKPSGADRMSIPVTEASNVDAAPSAFDWRSKNAVTPVKDQGQCGSCWAFSATETLESNWILAGNKEVILAPQQTVSCDKVDQGCNGGDTISAYAYMQKAGGVDTEKSYPYTSGAFGQTGRCKVKTADFAAHLTGYSYATKPCQGSCSHQDEDTLAANLASTSPVSICVDAESWQDYSSGVMTSNCPHGYDDLDHCVQLVGYDKSGNKPYWKVRNSWNTDWGIDGYIHIEMGKNLCGIADEATIVKV
eukprot:GFYU01001203.1.p2 GENE.GFYU01001203.1~~GFYU01001203.1.p2  ORF type:complete len:452 (-),score=180.96 GFYU01001203.1:195-1550(-)